MLRIEKTEDKQFPYIIHGIGGGRPQKFTDEALKELHKLISAEITIHNSDYAKCLESLKQIESLCDNTNPTHKEIWRIAYQHFT